MKAGDIVRIQQHAPVVSVWPEVEGQIGMIIALARRLYIPAAKVMVLGDVVEFDLDELKPI